MRVNVEEIIDRREPLKKDTKPTPEPKVEVQSKPEPQAPVIRNQKGFDEQKRLRQ